MCGELWTLWTLRIRCWSKPGRMGGMQELSLGDGCMWKGTVRHELMHTVGFWHEHQRPDRDDYVTIMLDNVDPAFHPQFEKISGSSTLDLPYDYGSIMHYGSHLNSINGRETIVPKLPLNGVVLGAAYRLSSLDVQKINKLYGCNK
ncbi:astacin-like metalloendopeptidase [Branchiostoma floridae x Branchiostoma belcheri]